MLESLLPQLLAALPGRLTCSPTAMTAHSAAADSEDIIRSNRRRQVSGLAVAAAQVTTTIGNLILGKIYVDHGGVMKVRNVTSGVTGRMVFKEQGLLRSKDLHAVRAPFSNCTSTQQTASFRCFSTPNSDAQRHLQQGSVSPGRKRYPAMQGHKKHSLRDAPFYMSCARMCTLSSDRGKEKLSALMMRCKWGTNSWTRFCIPGHCV